MKLGYVYYSEYEKKNSSGTQIINTVNALSELGCKSTLFATPAIYEYANYHDLPVKGKIAVHTPSIGMETIDRAYYYFLSLGRALASGLDVIYTRDISFLRFLRPIPDRLYPEIIYEAHSAYYQLNEMTELDEYQRLQQADQIITISSGIKKDIEKIGVKVDEVVWDAANSDYIPTISKQTLRQKLGMPQEQYVFVYTGSLYSSKYDIEGLINAFNALPQSLNASLFIVGGNEKNVDKYRKYIASLGASGTIHLTGHVSQREVFRYLKAADIGIVTQQESDIRSRKYTSPLKLFEYLLSGLIVVATKVPSIMEVANKEPRILGYNPNDPDSLKSTLETATKEHQSLQTESFAQQYSYQNRAKNILTVIDQSSSKS
jgi:glycosyltransferase involved in cell wall biosynthesis